MVHFKQIIIIIIILIIIIIIIIIKITIIYTHSSDTCVKCYQLA